ncbi:MAG: COP23 domain-containing protein [Microcoleaceae cyanobacterium]
MSQRLQSIKKWSRALTLVGLSLSLPFSMGVGSARADFWMPGWTPQATEWFPFPLPQNSEVPTNTSQQVNPEIESSQTTTATDEPIPQVEVTTTNPDDPRFVCEQVGNEYTVMYYPPSQQQAFPWAIPGQMGGGWTPERRCVEISRRLESYRPDGLSEMLTSVENGYNVICATTEDVPDCRIVLTVPVGESAAFVRDRIFQNLVVAESGGSTQGIYTLVDDRSGDEFIQDLFGRPRRSRSNGINLKPFLHPQDRGTGTQLR